MDEELKPCPFCGNIPELVEGQFGDWFVHCMLMNENGAISVCGVRPCTNFIEDYDGKHPGQNTRERAIRIWNKRA
jgi:hypothetical protein